MNLNCQTLSLMRTCQQAHNESTNILYGDNTFCFEDVLRDQDNILPSVEFSDACPPLLEGFNLYPFLSVIGRANGTKLRHLDLKFYTFYAVPNDVSVWDTNYDAARSLASSVNSALDLLSQSHRLQSLVLNFEGLYCSMARFSFCFSRDSDLIRSLVQFKAIGKLKCGIDIGRLYELDDAQYAKYEEAVHNYHDLRAELAAAYALESKRLASSSTKDSLQSHPITEFGASS